MKLVKEYLVIQKEIVIKKMKKNDVVLIIVCFILFLLGANHLVESYPVKQQASTPSFFDGGNMGTPFLVALSSTSATLIVSDSTKNRSIMIQNPINSSYDVAIGTWTGFSYNTARFCELAPSGAFITNGQYPLYGIIEPGGSSVSVIGGKESQDGD
jgi:hypothetical protein